MKRSHILFFSLLMLFVGCSKDSFTPTNSDKAPELLTRDQINEIVLDKLNSTGEFNWNMVDANVVHSALVAGDQVLDLGYIPAGEGDLTDRIHLIDINTPKWQAAKDKVLQAIVNKLNENSEKTIKLEDILMDDDDFFPHLAVQVSDYNVVKMLLEMEEVRFAEPGGYEDKDSGSNDNRDLGCGANPDYSIPTADYTNISPSVKRPWTLDKANVQNAWSTSQGDNITISILDTGSSPSQPKLGSQFASGQSTGRSIERKGFYQPKWWSSSLDGPDDQCGHGTQMMGLAVAPRGYNGTAVGVAYKSDLLACRVTADVFISNSREKRGVRNGLKYSANKSNVKVISMSLGTPFSSSTVTDGVNYAYNKGKMILAAAGTSLPWLNWVGVLFPATLSRTVAITGVKEGSPIEECNTCHYGSKVDFTAVMQRRNDDSRVGLTLAMSGYTPSSVSGSSCATATTAGIVGLIWATNPSMSRATVLQKMKNASANYPSKDSDFGYGAIDANQAVN
ncbi:MAG: S8 family serine peptidase [Saprospiraceae bacterium]